jgi:hypothetical protein
MASGDPVDLVAGLFLIEPDLTAHAVTHDRVTRHPGQGSRPWTSCCSLTRSWIRRSASFSANPCGVSITVSLKDPGNETALPGSDHFQK